MNDTPDEASNTGASAPGDSTQTEVTAEQKLAEAAQAIEALRAENAELGGKVLRAVAEMENVRRRVEREKVDVSKYAVTEFARDIVSVADNLRRAIDAVSKDAAHNPPLKTMLEGIEVTERELIKVFERHGVVRFDPTGEKFDPNVHEAMIKVDVPNVPENVIVQVVSAGYKINDRVLRPAAVVVSKGAPVQKPAEQPAAPEAEQAAEPEGQQGAGAKRVASKVTTPVTQNGHDEEKEDFISTLGKRMDSAG